MRIPLVSSRIALLAGFGVGISAPTEKSDYKEYVKQSLERIRYNQAEMIYTDYTGKKIEEEITGKGRQKSGQHIANPPFGRGITRRQLIPYQKQSDNGHTYSVNFSIKYRFRINSSLSLTIKTAAKEQRF